MKIRHLEILVAVIENGGPSRASEHLNMSQPAVSAAIKALEAELSVVLFERPSGVRRVRPTDAAMKFYLQARDILRRCEEARNSLKESGKQAPKVRIGVLHTLSAKDIASLQVRLVSGASKWRWTIREGSERMLAESLKSGKVDIAWTVVEGESADARVLWQEPYVAMLSRNHPLARRGSTSLSIADLNSEMIILRGRCELPRLTLHDAGLTARPAARAERDELAMSMVARGLGFAIAPRSLATSDVIALPIDDFDRTRNIGLKWRLDTSADAVEEAVTALRG
jgi:DNA-binding transcriptional LysR family regulator